MVDKTKIENAETEEAGAASRRKFLKSAATVAVTAPATVVLLNAATMNSAAAQLYIGFDSSADSASNDDTNADHCISNPNFTDFSGLHTQDCV